MRMKYHYPSYGMVTETDYWKYKFKESETRRKAWKDLFLVSLFLHLLFGLAYWSAS